MSQKRLFLKNTIVLGVGKFIPKIMAFVILPILTGKLSKAEYGLYDLITSLVALVLPVATLQIQSAAFRFLIDCRSDKDRIQTIITNVLVVTYPVSFIAATITSFVIPGLQLGVRIALLFYFMFDITYITVGQITRGLGNNKSYSLAAIILSIVDLICVVLMVYLKDGGLLGVIFALVVSNAVADIYLLYTTKLYKYINIASFSIEKTKDMIKYSWPMIPNNLSGWVLRLSDRLVITAMIGIEANAVYAVANKIPNMVLIASTVLSLSWQESASIALKEKDSMKYYSQMLGIFHDFLSGAAILIIGFMPILFKIFIRGDYQEAYNQIPVLILAMFYCAMASYYGGIYIAHKKTTSIGISTIIAAVINLTIDFVLVKSIGIWAGSVSTLVAYMMLYYYRMVNVRKFQVLNINYKREILQITMMLAMLALSILNKNYICVNWVLALILFTLFNTYSLRKIWALCKSLFKKGR